jgi:hypothetical protein
MKSYEDLLNFINQNQRPGNLEPLETIVEGHVFTTLENLKGFAAHVRKTGRDTRSGEYITVDVRPSIVADCGHIVQHPHEIAGKCQAPSCGKFHCFNCTAICALCLRIHCIGCLTDAAHGLLCCSTCVPKIREDLRLSGTLGFIETAERNAALLGGYIDQIR